MALNKTAIVDVAWELINHAKRYNQNQFGYPEDCGTTCCIAGFCYLNDIGAKAFNKQVKSKVLDEDACHKAGIKNLLNNPKIIANLDNYISQQGYIFGHLDYWPADLYDIYRDNNKALAGLLALSRVNSDGIISEDEDVEYTEIPYLDFLKNEYKAGRLNDDNISKLLKP